MKTDDVSINTVLQQKSLIIPVYQRNYAWRTKDCKRLFSDIESLVDNQNKYFLGCIVSVKQDEYENERVVIDGQQRLTSITLLYLAIYHIVMKQEKEVYKESFEHYGESLFNNFLGVTKKLADNYLDRIKLHLNPDDQEALERIFTEKDEPEPKSRIRANYEYFRNLVLGSKYKIEDIVKAIGHLIVVDIVLTPGDSPQRIFESLNSTGVGLTESDKIRNYILMDLEPEKQKYFYCQYWKNIEDYCNVQYNDNAISELFSYYLTLKTKKIPVAGQVYLDFKKNFARSVVQNEDFLKDLLSYACRYSYLVDPFKKPRDKKVIDRCVFRLNKINKTIVRPFFLEVLKLLENDKISIEDAQQVFLLTETYIVRKAVCHHASNGLNHLFAALFREVEKLDGTVDQFLEKFKYVLFSSKTSSSTAFPSDEEFIEAFSSNQTYIDLKNCKDYLLERLECFDKPESINVYEKLANHEISIEHIMPQKLTKAWQEALGSNAEEIKAAWTHRIANLTLTAYNSKLNNRDFQYKKRYGFDASGFHLNTFVSKCQKWTLDELEERDKKLRERALKIWASPIVTYTPPPKEEKSYTLADTENTSLKNTIPASYSYQGVNYPVRSWKQVLVRVVSHLYDENPAPILRIIQKKEPFLSTYLLPSKEGIKPVEIDPNKVYLSAYPTSTRSKLYLLRRLFKYYSIDPNKLVFYLSDPHDSHPTMS